MLPELTAYLFHYKKVCIPFIGCFEVRQLPANVNFAGTLINPPKITFTFYRSEKVPEHQLTFLAENNNTNPAIALNELKEFGNNIENELSRGIFEWKGIGVLKKNGEGNIDFISDDVKFPYLLPVEVEKIIHESPKAEVLQTDDMEVTATSHNETKTATKENSLMIVWVLILLALIFIAYQLYKYHFTSEAAGNKTKPFSSLNISIK